MDKVYFGVCLLAVMALPSCGRFFSPRLMPEDERKIAALEARIEAIPSGPDYGDYPENSYEFFVSHRYYLDTMVVYKDSELLEKADASCPIYICLGQQRGRLYVDGRVALDWPVSTGTESTPTSRGSFVVLEKKREHCSGRFGVIYAADGTVLEEDADSRKHTVPPGGRWEGAAMPNWMRLTDSGIGMHTGMVVPGQRLSHGCIRMPHQVASSIFDIVSLGSPVYVAEAVEAVFPCREALGVGDAIRHGVKARTLLTEQLDALRLEAEERAVVYADEIRREEVAAREAEEAERARRRAEEKASEEAAERAEAEERARVRAEREAAREAERAERARRRAEEKAAEEAAERAEAEERARVRAERARRREEERLAEEAAERAEAEERARRRAEEKAAEEAAERAEAEERARVRAERALRRAEEKAAEEAAERAEAEERARVRAERQAAREAERAERARRRAEEKAAEEAAERAEAEERARARAARRAAREAARAERARRRAEERAEEEAEANRQGRSRRGFWSRVFRSVGF